MWPVHISHLLFLLFGPSLLSAQQPQCDPGLQTFHNDERLALFNGHNELRKDIAEGKQPNQQGKLPPAKNMYRLIYDCDMEVELMKEMDQCTGRATLTETYGQNFLVLPAAIMPALGGGNDPKSNRLKVAMGVWKGPQTYYGLNNISDYDDNRLYTFANMAHAKTLRFGCGYKECNNNADVHISCIYNLEGGYPHSVIYEKGKACEKNKDCTTYKGSKCDQKLCVFEGKPPVPGGGENKMCRGNKGMTDPGRTAILEAHNKRRSQLAKGQVRNGKNPNNNNLKTASYMPRMTYDCVAETAAMDYASTCALTKSPENERKGYGENVFIYNVPNAVPADAFKAAAKKWWDQIFLDGINWEVVFKQSLKDKPIDQKSFTQMAWANSVKIGCGIQTCGMKSFVVCRYSPP
ncbi:hypothetical protein Y032_0046g1371 [Ancylostoma ceylanicum]|uniref:SCP domain-containing protein n=1 Tax=Ancylostoma ceylanicum TaxID=53326 RepID=A0A016UBK5_9BILA|nr:hypothetical protein Y032_0046g1371 [Ancylostoma ceylanicum]